MRSGLAGAAMLAAPWAAAGVLAQPQHSPTAPSAASAPSAHIGRTSALNTTIVLRDVLAAAGARGDTLRLWALNDDRVDTPASDPLRDDVLLARPLDDQAMRVRDEGPLFVAYPFDQVAELRGVVFYSRSTWQLRAIQVL